MNSQENPFIEQVACSAKEILARADPHLLAMSDFSQEEAKAIQETHYLFKQRRAGVLAVSSDFFKAEPYSCNCIEVSYSPAAFKSVSEGDAESLMMHELYHTAKDYRAVKYGYEYLRMMKQLLYFPSSPRIKGARALTGIFAAFQLQDHLPLPAPYNFAVTALALICMTRTATIGIRSEEKKANRAATLLTSVSSEESTAQAVSSKKDENMYERINHFFYASKNPVVMAVNNLAAFAVNFSHPLPFLRQQQNRDDMLLKENYLNQKNQFTNTP